MKIILKSALSFVALSVVALAQESGPPVTPYPGDLVTVQRQMANGSIQQPLVTVGSIVYAGSKVTVNAVIDGNVPTNGVSDTTAAFNGWFSRIAAIATATNRVTAIIPAGTYQLALKAPIIVPSYVTVIATGAVFCYPVTLSQLSGNSQYPTIDAFEGTDVNAFLWVGGRFNGYVFNPALANYLSNTWLPIEGVVTFDFESTAGNGCHDCTWEGVYGLNTGGSVVMVAGINSGTSQASSYNYTNVTTASSDIRILGCHFTNCGQFLWNYGRLWMWKTFQLDEYTQNQINMANAYMTPISQTGSVGMANGAVGIVTFTNKQGGNPSGVIPSGVAGSYTGAPSNSQQYTVSFYYTAGGNLPSNITRGQQYFIIASSATSITISATYNGGAITFSSGGVNVGMIFNITNAYSNALVPYGGGQRGDGAFNLQNTTNIIVGGGTTFSSAGDGYVCWACTDIDFDSSVQETYAKMGMIWFSACLRARIHGGTYESTEGSRSVTLDFGCVDTLIDGASVIGGSRGSYADSAVGLLVHGCKFSNNNNASTTNNWATGQIDPVTGTWTQFSAWGLTTTFASTWSNVAFTDNQILTNSPIQVLTNAIAGSGFLWDNNVCTGIHLSLGNNTSVISGAYVGRGIGLVGFVSGISNQTLGASATTFTIANPCGTSVQTSNGVGFIFKVFPLNANSPQATFVTCTNTTGTATIPATTGAVSYAYEFQEIWQ